MTINRDYSQTNLVTWELSVSPKVQSRDGSKVVYIWREGLPSLNEWYKQTRNPLPKKLPKKWQKEQYETKQLKLKSISFSTRVAILPNSNKGVKL